MILDKNLQLSSAQVVTAAAASSNYIDMSAVKDVGNSGLVVVITCDQTATAAGAATVQFQLQEDTDSAFGTAVNVLETDAIGKAALTAGMAPIFLPVPPGFSKQYLRLYFNVATGPLTAGKFTVNVVPRESIQNFAAYKAANYN
jgi:hypothetical protein